MRCACSAAAAITFPASETVGRVSVAGKIVARAHVEANRLLGPVAIRNQCFSRKGALSEHTPDLIAGKASVEKTTGGRRNHRSDGSRGAVQ